MTAKDWIYLALTVGGYLVAVIAGIYAKDKAKINKATAAGKAMDVVGQLATYAVHEAERTDMSGAGKRRWAAEAVSQGLDWLGIKGVTPIAINGAIEHAVAEMNAVSKEMADQQAADKPVDAKEISDQVKKAISTIRQTVDQPVDAKNDQPAQPAESSQPVAADQQAADQPAQPAQPAQPEASKEEVEDVK